MAAIAQRKEFPFVDASITVLPLTPIVDTCFALQHAGKKHAALAMKDTTIRYRYTRAGNQLSNNREKNWLQPVNLLTENRTDWASSFRLFFELYNRFTTDYT